MTKFADVPVDAVFRDPLMDLMYRKLNDTDARLLKHRDIDQFEEDEEVDYVAEASEPVQKQA